jgi:hypothetical protein
MRPVYDEKDAAIVEERNVARMKLYAETNLPMVGDVVIMPDGPRRRVAHCYGDSAQPSMHEFGSHHFGSGGAMDFSGALEPSIPYSRFVYERMTTAPAWIFHHGWVTAHNGVEVTAHVRQWRIM